ATNVLTTGTKFQKFGSGHPDLVPHQAFPAKDGHFIVACLTNAFWKRLCVAIGREDLDADERFSTMRARVKNRAELVPILSDVFRPRDCEHWIRLLSEHDTPACRVNELEETLESDQLAANDMIVTKDHPVRGK